MACPAGQVDVGQVLGVGEVCQTPDQALATVNALRAKWGLPPQTAADYPAWFPVTPPGTLTKHDQSDLTLTGNWLTGTYPAAYQGSDRYTAEGGATATVAFDGTTITLFGTKASHHGSMDIQVDAGAKQRVSEKATTRAEQQQVWKAGPMSKGVHTVTVTVVGDGVISLDRFDVDGPLAEVPPPVVTPPPPSGGGLVMPAVVGNELQVNGKRFVFRGTNFYAVEAYTYPGDTQMPAVNRWHASNAGKIAAELAGYGVNWIRLPVNNRTDPGYVAQIKTIADANAAHGIYTMLVAFGGVGSTPTTTAGQLLGALWVALGKPQHVTLNTINEPHQIDNGTWQNGTIAEIDAIRRLGYPGVILCDCQNWAWNLPVTEARNVRAHDGQVVFMSHRYAFDGSSNRPGNDYQAWQAEWSQAKDLAVAVGEYGWFNGGGNYNQPWLQGMADAIVAGVKAGWLTGALSWMWLWDQNSHIVGANTGGDWWPISQGENWKLNPWGSIAKGGWTGAAALVP